MNSEMHPYAGLLGIHVINVGEGTAIVRAKVGQAHTNRIGIAHGGFIHSVADYAFELASNSHGVVAVALTTNMQFHRPVSVGATLEAVAKETYLGKKTATYHVEVRSENEIVASFTGTVYRRS